MLATALVPMLVMKARAPPRPTKGLVDRTAFRDAPYLLLKLGLFFGFMGLYVIFYYIQLLALALTTVSSTLADYLLVIINGSSLFGRLIPGYYADRIGSINVQTAVALMSAILTLCLLAIRDAPGLIVFKRTLRLRGWRFHGAPCRGCCQPLGRQEQDWDTARHDAGLRRHRRARQQSHRRRYPGGKSELSGLIVWCGVLLVASSVSMAASRVMKVGPGLMRVI